MPAKTINVITGPQGAGKRLSLRQAIKIFALDRMRSEIQMHWAVFKPHEDFSDAFNSAVKLHEQYYPDENPLQKQEWIHEYVAVFRSAHLNELGNISLEFSHQGKPKFYSVKLFEKFLDADSATFLLDETRLLINAHIFSLFQYVEERFADFVIKSVHPLFGKNAIYQAATLIDVARKHWSLIDCAENRLVLSDGTIYENVEVVYDNQNNKLKQTKVEEFADLMDRLLSADEISGASAADILYECGKRVASAVDAGEIDIGRYSKIVGLKPPYRLNITRNTVGEAKKILLLRKN